MASGSSRRPGELIAVVAILLLALGLRLYRLDAQSLWNDEGTSVALAQRDLATITRHASYDIHPPLYYYLLHGWISVAGTSEAAVRSLSVVAGVALVAGVWALARRLVGPGAATPAALAAAVAPLQVYYSQEARMYIWAALFGLLATLAFERLLSDGRPLSPTLSPGTGRGGRSVAPSGGRHGMARDLDSRGASSHDDMPLTPALSPGTGRGSRSVVPSAGRHGMARDLDLLSGAAASGNDGVPYRAAHAILYALAAIATIYSHYLGATVLVAHNLAFLAWWTWRWRAASSLAPYSGRGWGRGEAWRTLGGWALLQVLVVLAYVPWLALSWRSLRNWPAVSADFSVAAMLADALRALVWGPAADVRRGTTAAALGVAALAAVGMIWAWDRGSPERGDSAQGDKVPRYVRDDRGGAWDVERRRPSGNGAPRWFGASLLALYLVTPLALMALASLQRPMYKTKFAVLVAPAFCVLVGAGVAAIGAWVTRLARQRTVGIAVAALVMLGALAPAAQGLARLYWDPTTYRDDYRGIAAYIAATAGPHDAILINAPSQIETFGYYYQGPLPVYPLPRQRPINAQETLTELEGLAAQHDHLYAVLWATNESDPEGVIETWLDSHAFKAMDRWYGNVRLAMWAMPRSSEGVEVVPAGHILGGWVRLDGYSLLTPEPAPGEVLQVALHWRALAPTPRRYKVFVHLVDAQGAIVTQRDSEPAGGSRLTSDWAPGEAVIDLYGLVIPAEALPGEHVLRVGMYGLDDGQRLPVTLDGGVVPNAEIGDAIDLTRVTIREKK